MRPTSSANTPVSPTSRRRVVMLGIAGACAALAATGARAQSHVDEADDIAKGLGYKHDSKTVDAKKYPQHSADQVCHGCQFWQGTPTDAWAGCAMFGRKQVSAGGWCSAYKKV